MKNKYAGIFPAFYACYDKNGEINPQGVQDLTEDLIGKGVTGLYVGGSSGECIYQSVYERKLVLENVIYQSKMILMLYGVIMELIMKKIY